ncbi:unnamed protein product [Camellia sinensis]
MAMGVRGNMSRYECFYMAKLAQQANRYKDTVNFMEKLIIGSTSSSSGSELTIEERNLLSTATKKVMDSLRAAWRALSSTEQNHNNHVALVTDYKSKIESELSHICNRVLNLLEKHLIPSASKSESKVFYLKMKGDYYRYMTEFKVGTERTEAAENTIMAYEAAEAIAVSELSLQPFPRGWVWHSISLFSATRLKVHQRKRVAWRGRPMRKPWLSLTVWETSHTRKLVSSSCN